MAQRLRDGLGKLKTLSDNAEKMEQALTLVAEVAEELAGQAEDVDIIVMPDDMDMMEKQAGDFRVIYRYIGTSSSASAPCCAEGAMFTPSEDPNACQVDELAGAFEKVCEACSAFQDYVTIYGFMGNI